MLYILSGEDDFSLAQSLEEIKREIGDPASVAVNTTLLDGQQVTLDQLRTVCGTAPFLTGRRLVIIEGLLGRFEPRSRIRPQRRARAGRSSRGAAVGGQSAPAGESGQPDEINRLAGVISGVPDTTVLALVDGKITSHNPLLREIAAKAVAKSFPILRDAKLRQWVRERITAEGSAISPRAVDLLVRMVGGNLWVMAGEIDKLARYADGRRIEEGDVKLVVSYAQQANVFALADAFVDFRADIAGQLLEQLLQRGTHPAYLLTMLTRQVRMIFRARELRQQVNSPAEMQSRLGLTSEYALRKTLEQASRYSYARLSEVYHHLLEADLWIKTGKYSGELALNILVAELCRRGRSPTVGRRPA